MPCKTKTRLEVGDLVRFKISALHPSMTDWLKDCARKRVPAVIFEEYEWPNVPVEHDLMALGTGRVFQILLEDTMITAAECELTKRGL